MCTKHVIVRVHRIIMDDKKPKTILILGNGFDLAHGLPTKYGQFLEFCKRAEVIWTYRPSSDGNTEENYRKIWIEGWETDAFLKESLFEEFCKRKIHSEEGFEVMSDNPVLSEIHANLEDNIWYKYFIKTYELGGFIGENWIDFEAEIRFVIQSVDRHSSKPEDSWNDAMDSAVKAAAASMREQDKLRMLQKIVNHDRLIQKNSQIFPPEITIGDFINKIRQDLQRLIRGFELYLGAYVEKIQDKGIRLPEIESIVPDHVIDLNYTDTYEKLYGKGDVFHIHGTANVTRPPEENNMVLGTDEYWPAGERDERTNFIMFRKSIQRIKKSTGSEHQRILEEIRKIYAEGNFHSGNGAQSEGSEEAVSNVYILGCSLGSIDKDILSGFIRDGSTSVVIYCKDKDAEDMLMKNTIQLIDQDMFLCKSTCSPSKLEYRLLEAQPRNR